MTKLKRGNYVFLTFKGDHDPRHVHVFKNGQEIAKYDLENNQLMDGLLTRRLKRIVRELQKEGRL